MDWATEIKKGPAKTDWQAEMLGPQQEDSSSPYFDTAATMVTGAIAEPIAGLRGLVASIAPGEPGAGARTVQATRDALTYRSAAPNSQRALQAVGEAVSPVTDSLHRAQKQAGYLGEKVAGPVGGAVAEGAAAVLPVLLPVGRAGEAVAPLTNAIKSVPGRVRERFATRPPLREKVEPTLAVEQQRITKDIAKERPQQVAEAVNPDSEIMAAAAREGVDLSPSHYSRNVSYIELEQKLKANPASQLAAQEAKAITQIGERADKLIDDLGGSTDRTIFDHKLRSDIETNIARLESKSNQLYNKVSESIPPTAQVSADASKTYIESTLSELGGRKELLRGPEADLLALLDTDKGLTYAALDRLRKEVGLGFRRSGVYKDVDSGILKRVYGALSDDQLSVGAAFGVGDDLSLAQRLVASRKGLEEQSIALFGRDLQRSSTPAVRQAATQLVKGDPAALTKLLNAVPKGLRQDAAVAILSDIFTAGSRAGGRVGGGFATAWEGLSRNNGALQALLKELPPDARQRFTDLGKISQGLYRAKARENTSGTAKAILANLDAPGLVSKLYDVGPKVVTAEGIGSAMGVPGAGTAAVALAKAMGRRTSATQAADAFLSSPQLRQAIEVAARGDAAAANKIVSGTKQYKEWLASRHDAAEIAKVGFVSWLSSEESS